MSMNTKAARALLAVGLACGALMAHAADISVMASVAFKDAYLEMVPAFERATGHKVTTQWVPTVEIMRRIKADEAVDLVLMANNGIVELTRLGKLEPGSSVAFVKSGIGMASRAGSPRLDVSSADALKRTLLSAKSIAYSTGPSGTYLAGLFERMGIADAIKAKTTLVQGEPVGALVARGDAEIGFQQIPEILPVAGIQYLGPLPADIQQTTVFVSGLHSGSQHAQAARAWVKYLTTPEAAVLYRKYGMEPG